MSTVAHTVLEFGPGQEVKVPGPPKRRLVVNITATYIVDSTLDAQFVEDVLEQALDILTEIPEVDKDGEEPTARVEIHNIPEESGT